MIAKCKTCGIEVTKSLKELTNNQLLNNNDGQNFVPEGYYVKSEGVFMDQQESIILIHKEDLINSNYHSSERRLNGCCGYNGLDGMNRICLQNHEIGTEYSDCWMSHKIALSLDCIDII